MSLRSSPDLFRPTFASKTSTIIAVTTPTMTLPLEMSTSGAKNSSKWPEHWFMMAHLVSLIEKKRLNFEIFESLSYQEISITQTFFYIFDTNNIS